MTTPPTTTSTRPSATPRPPAVAEVTDADFADVVLASDRPVLVKFTATWCGPCRQLRPVLAALAAEHSDRLKVVEVDVDTNPLTTLAHHILATPTLLLFRDGVPVKTITGTRSKHRLLQDLTDVL